MGYNDGIYLISKWLGKVHRKVTQNKHHGFDENSDGKFNQKGDHKAGVQVKK